jgi:hypothetical protein
MAAASAPPARLGAAPSHAGGGHIRPACGPLAGEGKLVDAQVRDESFHSGSVAGVVVDLERRVVRYARLARIDRAAVRLIRPRT